MSDDVANRAADFALSTAEKYANLALKYSDLKTQLAEARALLGECRKALEFYGDGGHYSKCNCDWDTLPEDCPHASPEEDGEIAREAINKLNEFLGK